MEDNSVYFWFRRDLRLNDNHGLYKALTSGSNVRCIFIFDTNILDKLEDKQDARVQYIHNRLHILQEIIKEYGSSLSVYHGSPLDVWKQILNTEKVKSIYCNHDYEPQAIQRDREISELAVKHKVAFHSFKDQVIFEKNEVLKDDGKPYTVFTPYSRKWKTVFHNSTLEFYPSEKYLVNLIKSKAQAIPSLSEIGFYKSDLEFPSTDVQLDLIRSYDKTRDYPFIKGTSRLGLHLRFGSISIRKLVNTYKSVNETFLNELIWREFYQMILFHFPYVVKGAFRKEYDLIRWENNEALFDKWCKGETGYPIVDAGMRELNNTGYMHNRVRMIVASFLTKHLLIDWRWGEAYFAQKLLDFDLAANNGGWQWAAGCGCDAAPYFRVFNPTLQTEKFDGEFKYIKKWVPEFQELTYSRPIVEHSFARNRAIERYKQALKPV